MNEHELRIIIYHRCIRGDIIKNIITNKYQSKLEARHELERYNYKIEKVSIVSCNNKDVVSELSLSLTMSNFNLFVTNSFLYLMIEKKE